MKILVDENLPPALAHALQALFKDSHHIEHARSKFGPGKTDLEWINQLNNEGRWIVLSADRRITRNRAEFRAFQSSKLIGFFLSSGLQKAGIVKQMVRILILWDAITHAASSVEGGAMFELPMKSTRVSQLKFPR